MTDRKLWQPDPGASLTSAAENARVRDLMTAYLEKEAGSMGGSESAYGSARHQLAKDWVRMAKELGLKLPGEPRRTPLSPGENPRARHIDAAHTRIRQFQEGHMEYAWVLIGIESAICDREGMQLPPKAYEGQGTLI